jgi:hypothetical protein
MKIKTETPRFESLEERIAYKKRVYAEAKKQLEKLEETRNSASAFVFYVTPAKLIVWKCGFSCEGHSRESVQKWIADVDAYYSEMMALEGAEEENE